MLTHQIKIQIGYINHLNISPTPLQIGDGCLTPIQIYFLLMYFPKASSSGSGLQFGSPKTTSTPQSSEGNKITFSKYPALSKHNLNMSTDETVTSYSKFQGRIASPAAQSQTVKHEVKSHTRHATQITDSLEGSKSFTDNFNVAALELEFQISSLKTENRRLKEEYERKMDFFGGEKEVELETLNAKINALNQQTNKDKLRIEGLVSSNQKLTSENKSLQSKLQENKNRLLSSVQKTEQAYIQSQSLKQQLKSAKIHHSELQNIINKLQTQISQSQINLKNAELRFQQIKPKCEHYKNLVFTISQEKTLLNNRISQLIEDQAKLQNAEVISRSEQNNLNFEKINKQLTQQIAHLKKKINDLLNQQQSSSLKMLYENKIIIMEREIQQLKHRYQSPESINVSHDRSEQQWKGIVDEKNRQIAEFKNIVSSLQAKISQLNKELVESQPHKSSSYSANFELETEISNLKIEIKGYKKALQTADEKLKYLISQGKKKDDFLKQYMSATTHSAEELILIDSFFKKYEIQIPHQGFSQIHLRQIRRIQELEEKVDYMSNRLYGGK